MVNYQWRVKGVNSGFETPFEQAAFTVNGDSDADIVPPNTPVLVSPFGWGHPRRDQCTVQLDA